MTRFLIAGLTLLLLESSAFARSVDPVFMDAVRRNEQTLILQAASLGDRIWAIHGDGTLKAYDVQTGAVAATSPGANYFALRRHGHDLWTLRWREFPAENQTHTVIVTRRSDRSADEVVAPPLTFAVDEGIAAFVVTDEGAVILTSAQMYRLDGQEWVATPIGHPAFRGLSRSFALLADGHTLYLGFDNGEWGGGLQRFDLQTHRLENVERRDSNDLCAGPLNSECDPVTGVVADVSHPGCVVVTTGLAHLTMLEGKVLRVCGSGVQPIFERRVLPPPVRPGEQWIGPAGTTPFYGLAVSPHGFWVMSEDRMFEIQGDRMQGEHKIDLQQRGDLRFDRSFQGVLLVASRHTRIQTPTLAYDIGNTLPEMIQEP